MHLRDRPEVNAEIERAKRWVWESRQLTADIQFDSSLRRRIAASLLLISMEHQLGILSLMDLQQIAPARALLRSQFDAFMRGVWFLEKATEDQIKEFAGKPHAKNIPPVSYRALVEAIEAVQRYSDGSFSRLESTIQMLHDFTHGGKRAVGAYISLDEIAARFSLEDVTTCLHTSAVIGFLACMEIVGISKKEGLPSRLHTAYVEIYPEMRR